MKKSRGAVDRKTLSTLTERTYEEYFHHLLWFEETKERERLQEQNVERVKLQRTTSVRIYTVIVPGMEQKQRYVRTDDYLLLKSQFDSKKIYAKIDDIDIKRNKLTISLLKYMKIRISDNEEFKLVFLFSNHQYASMHKAIDSIMTDKCKTKIFPKKNMKCNKRNSIITWFNPEIARNAEQRMAVEHIVARTSSPAPYILHGPPGTGKTATIVEAILQVLDMDPSSKVMVCAPSNSAADDVACKLVKYESLFPMDIFLLRRNSSKRDRSTLPASLNKHSQDPFTKSKSIPYDQQIKPVLKQTRIIVSTICYAPQAARDLPFITHMFIDEAAQATEPMCLVPIQKLLVPDGLLVLSGDPLQLGPVLTSQHAKEYGLGISLMERLMEDGVHNKVGNDPNYTVMLKKNYRSHADILQIPNNQFYERQLKACAKEDVVSRRNILIEGQHCRAIAFYPVFGQETQESKSSSYYNEDELMMLKFSVKKLTEGKHKEDPENIGIITPYTAQVHKIKKWLESKGQSKIEVGSVESYQGREKKVILMSTVRGQGEDAEKKVKLGFLADSKRFNVALTRAKAKLIVIGNPISLQTDKLWRIFIETCKGFGSYHEISLANIREEKKTLDLSSALRKMRISRRKSRSHNLTADVGVICLNDFVSYYD